MVWVGLPPCKIMKLIYIVFDYKHQRVLLGKGITEPSSGYRWEMNISMSHVIDPYGTQIFLNSELVFQAWRTLIMLEGSKPSCRQSLVISVI